MLSAANGLPAPKPATELHIPDVSTVLSPVGGVALAHWDRMLSKPYLRLVLAATFLCTGCRASNDRGESAAAACGTDAAVDFFVPTETLSDWVSYGDQMSVVTVIAEHPIAPNPLQPGEPPRSRGWIGRTIDVRVDATVWHRDGAQPAPGSVTFVTDGWGVDGKGQADRPMTFGEGPRLEVGRTYVMGLVQRSETGWGPFPRSTLPVGADGRLESNPCSQRTTLREISGLTPDEVGAKLAATPAQPTNPGYVR